MKVSGVRVTNQGLSFQLSSAREWISVNRPKQSHGAGVAYCLEVRPTEEYIRLVPSVRSAKLSLPSEEVLRRLARRLMESDYRECEMPVSNAGRSCIWIFIRAGVHAEIYAAFLGAVAFNAVIPEGYHKYG